MNITLNLSEEDIQTAVADYIRNNGYDIEDPAAIVFTDAANGITASLEVDMGAPTAKEEKPEPKKRTRRSSAQVKADNEKALAEAAVATTAEDKGTPEPEAEPETGNIADLEKEKSPEVTEEPVSQPGSSSLFATA